MAERALARSLIGARLVLIAATFCGGSFVRLIQTITLCIIHIHLSQNPLQMKMFYIRLRRTTYDNTRIRCSLQQQLRDVGYWNMPGGRRIVQNCQDVSTVVHHSVDPPAQRLLLNEASPYEARFNGCLC